MSYFLKLVSYTSSVFKVETVTEMVCYRVLALLDNCYSCSLS